MSTRDTTPKVDPIADAQIIKYAAALMSNKPRKMILEASATHCETCGGDGSETHRFDGNCPAQWAHRFVR